jgi:hypothetical protein
MINIILEGGDMDGYDINQNKQWKHPLKKSGIDIKGGLLTMVGLYDEQADEQMWQ